MSGVTALAALRVYNATRNVTVPLCNINVPPARYITLAAYLAAFVFGLCGNSLVIYVVTRFSKVRLKSVANYYIWNLALADLLFICALPLFCWATFFRSWPFRGAVLSQLTCRLAYAARETSRFAGVFTLIALSIDRCLATFPHQRHLRTICAGKLVCSAIWIVSFLLSTPFLLYATTTPKKSPFPIADDKVKCSLAWPGPRNGNVVATWWTYARLCVNLVLPSCVILVAYGVMWRRVHLAMDRARAPTAAAAERRRRPNRKMTRTVLVIVITFVLCQTPYHVVQMLSLRKWPTSTSKEDCSDRNEMVRYIYTSVFAQMLVFTVACCNPILYGLLNDNYSRLYSLLLWRCFFCRRGPSVSETDPQGAVCLVPQPISEHVVGKSETANGGERVQMSEALVEVTAETEVHC